MKLIETDPKKLRDNPSNPRRTTAGPDADAVLVANIQAVGILQPPTAREVEGKLVLIAGHRRRDAAIKAGIRSIHVLVREDGDEAGADQVRALSENMVRAGMNPVDQWATMSTGVPARSRPRSSGCPCGPSLAPRAPATIRPAPRCPRRPAPI